MTLIGASVARPDARDKVTGVARYPADLIRPGMAHGKAVFSGRAHARILGIDVRAARELRGVIAVLTAADVPYNAYGLIAADQEVLCSARVRYAGDRVALVVAETPDIAAAGAALVRVEYEDLPAVTDARAAMLDDAPRVHPERGTSNVLLHQAVRKGDVERGFAAADIVLDGTFTTSWQEHAYLQPDAAIAYYEGETLVVETAGQWLHEDRRQLAVLLGVPETDVVVRYAKIGGAFGGREDLSVQALVALATWKLKRPVAIVWTREEAILGHHKRHPFHITARWGARRDGTIVAVQTRSIADGGAYASTSVEVLKCAAIFAQGPYRVPNIATDAYVTYTNNVPSGAFRGFGAPQAHWAAESMIARIAHALGLDPVEVRRRNLYREGDTEATRNVLPAGVSAIPVLERCAAEVRARFAPRRADPTSTKRRGFGIASGIKNVGYSFGFPEQATATVELIGRERIERAVVRVGVADVGQGAALVMRQIAAERLALPLSSVAIVNEDSAQAPNAGSASASRLTYMAGRAVHDASAQALANFAAGHGGDATVQFRPAPTTCIDRTTGEGEPNYCYGYVAQAVEVEVDVTTGVTQVLRIISVHDVGRAINRQQVEGQIEGCLAQALGYALTENLLSRDGRILTPYLSTYLLPTTLDMPTEIIPVIMELADPHGPYGARGMSEMPLVPFAPAVAAAIHDATGVWLSDLPMTPERILRAIEAARETVPATAALAAPLART